MTTINVTDRDGRQIKPLKKSKLDMEMNGGDMDFELIIPMSEWNDKIAPGGRFFVQGSEIGGILGEPTVISNVDAISFKGHTWRGRLARKIIVPTDGQDYYTVSGELNSILRSMINPRFGGVFVVPEIDTGVNVEYQFNRFDTLLDGFIKMLKSVDYKLKIEYNMGEPNGCGWVDVYAVPIVDYSNDIELSQDSNLVFTMTDKKDGVNHMIVGGKGELKDRNVLHLYAQPDGSVGDTKYYTGIDEIEYFYENTSTDEAELRATAIEKMKELMNKKTFEMDVEKLGIDVEIGDIIGGRDYRTGMSMKKPLENIVIKIENGVLTKEYKLEGN